MKKKDAIIEELALKVRGHYSDIAKPIDCIDDVVMAMQGEIKRSASMYSLSDGTYTKYEDGSFEIEVPAAQSAKLQNISIARNLGYVFMNDSREALTSNNVYRFALSFLMPPMLYQEVARSNTQNGMANVAEIAAFFHVPIESAVERGKQLDLLERETFPRKQAELQR